MSDYDFQVDYAKSDRSSCRGCRDNIPKDAFRVARMVQSDKFDGKIPFWYHSGCFFKKPGQIPSVTAVKGVEQLRWEDAERLRKYTGESIGDAPAAVPASASAPAAAAPSAPAKKGRGGAKAAAATAAAAEPAVEAKGTKRGRGKAATTDAAASSSATAAADTSDAKRVQTAAATAADAARQLNERLWAYKNGLSANCSAGELKELLALNDQNDSGSLSTLVERVAERLVHGRIPPCPQCKNSTLSYGNGRYKCHGHQSEWSACTYEGTDVKRVAFKFPPLKDMSEYLQKLSREVKATGHTEPVIIPLKAKPVFAGQLVAFINDSTFSTSLAAITKLVADQAGMIQKTVSARVNFVVCGSGDNLQATTQGKAAVRNNVPVVREGFVAACIAANRLLAVDEFLVWPVENKSAVKVTTLPDDATARVVRKGRSVVDVDSGLADKGHILEEGADIYNVMLNLTDISRQVNSYYGLQLIEHDNKNRWYVFYKWGRVGTSIGSNKVDEFYSKDEAKRVFREKYVEKTENDWETRKNFEKVPGKFFEVELDYDDDTVNANLEAQAGVVSKLDRRVSDLMSLIFDIKAMEATLAELEIDLKKMPLGKLSKNHIKKGYDVLSAVQAELKKKKPNAGVLLDLSNQFYTTIPHDFGQNNAPLLDNEALLKEKVELMETLLDIEIATSLMKGGSQAAASSAAPVHPADQKYDSLKCNLVPVEKGTPVWDLVVKYMKQTHAATHQQYTLELVDLFQVAREGERERYDAFRKLHNRMLLWHGSRVTNFAGILSQGLRIAPPEAPVTGYMFGKGVYFADMVSKSANYCRTTSDNNTGLMLLCDVALGDMYKLTHAQMMDKPPKGLHSTMGCGSNAPDPAETAELDGATVPLGKPKTVPVAGSLMYNEFIVYSTAQLEMKYLLRVKFNYKQGYHKGIL